MSTDSTPNNYRGATPVLCAKNAERAIDLCNEAFGATETKERIIDSTAKIGHAELMIENCRIMIADEFPEHNRMSHTLGGTPVTIHGPVDNVDNLARCATGAGAKLLRPISDVPYGRVQT